jgi:MFS family permease
MYNEFLSQKKSAIMKDKIRDSLKYSILDGAFYSVMFGFGDTYINPFAVSLKFSERQIGLLTALPGLSQAIAQYHAPGITSSAGRKKTMVAAVLLHGLMWLPISLLYFFRGAPPLFLIAFFSLYSVFGSLASPAWSSIMGQYIPPDKRGAYFSWRNKLLGIITLTSSFAAGLVIYLLNFGFAIIFAVAMLCRLVSFYFLTGYYEPRAKPITIPELNILRHLRHPFKGNFKRFIVIICLMNFSVYLSASFFPFYMLRDLGFNYLTYTIITTTATFTMFLTLRLWGRYADRFGNLAVIKISSILLAAVPLLWTISRSVPYLVVVQMIGGIGWGGFTLATVNFVYDASSEEKQIANFAYMNMATGLGLFAGSILGGIALPHLPVVFGYRVLTLFAVSAVFRTVVVFMLQSLKEVRNVEKPTKGSLIYDILGLKLPV